MKIKSKWFLLATIIYFIAYVLPSFSLKANEVLLGAQCAYFAASFMFTDVVFFLGNVSNIMVLTFFILKLAKVDQLKRWPVILKIIPVLIMLVSVAVWVILFGTRDSMEAFHIGYYIWALACLGIVITLSSKFL